MQNKQSSNNIQQFPENCNFQQQTVVVYQPKCFKSEFTASRMKMVDYQREFQQQNCLIQTSSNISAASIEENDFDPPKISSNKIPNFKSLMEINIDNIRQKTSQVIISKDGSCFMRSRKQTEEMHKKKIVKKFDPIMINNDMFIGYKKSDIRRDFIFHNKIGYGSYGDVFLATCKQSNQTRAIKALKKQKLKQRNSLLQKTTEICLLKSMDHPNIVRVFDIYLDKSKLYIIMENCEGGPLNCFKLHYKQCNVKKVMLQLLSAVGYVHSKGYIHRDIKLNNILLYQKHTIDKNFFMKLIDFGLCQKFTKGHMNREKVGGTLGYIAPEVFNIQYNQLSDVWSCGVVLYILLSGVEPFYVPNNNKATIYNVINKEVNLSQKKWDNISAEAKSLIRRMLQRNVKKRITVEEAMNHEWFKDIKKARSSESFDECLFKLENLEERTNNLISLIESYLTFKKVSPHQQKQLANIFSSLDRDGNGVIDKEELRQAFQGYLLGSKHLDHCEQIINRIDKNRSGKIDFSEFMVAMFDKSQLYENQIIEEFFKEADIYQRGFIRRNQLKILLRDSGREEIQYLFNKLDSNKDNKITLDEFKAYLERYFEGNSQASFATNMSEKNTNQSIF